MRVNEAMTRDVRIANPNDTIREAAQAMAEIDAGALPVGENDRLVGMITDRDITVRAVAAGKAPDTPIGEIMSRDVCYCFDDQSIGEVAANMGEIKVRRLPVVNHDKRLVGILSLGDMALAEGHGKQTTEALCGICEPGGQHSQSNDSQKAAVGSLQASRAAGRRRMPRVGETDSDARWQPARFRTCRDYPVIAQDIDQDIDAAVSQTARQGVRDVADHPLLAIDECCPQSSRGSPTRTPGAA